MRNKNLIKPSEITPENAFFERRSLIKAALALGLLPGCQADVGAATMPADGEFTGLEPWPGSLDIEPNSWEDITTYNNYYEFGTGKGDPARNAHTLETSPWSVEVTGLAGKTGTYTLEDILRPHTLEDRIYRFRCVERWSMVVPWVGFPLADLLQRFEPAAGARYVQFFTLNDPEQMPGVRSRVLDWPYREGLRMDEAMHPLTLLTVGVYGKVLPNQNGAPLRLIVPWKYGYKSIKAVARITLTRSRPVSSWQQASPSEYGFYGNVNPDVAHPRWSQRREVRVGELGKRDTLPFNGYAEQVAGLYVGMDPQRHF